jgi:hypothetical protein
MTKRILLSLVALFLLSVPALSQEIQSDSAHHSKKAIRISGKVGEEGKFILCDQHHRALKVSNPEVLRENAGRHVQAKAQLSPAGDEIVITSVKLIQEQTVSYNPSDSAFRR